MLGRITSGALGIRQAATEIPSPFAPSLQFGFVMDWMYGDDTPRAEQRAALLSLDRAMLDEVMGGEGSDDITLEAIEQTLAERVVSAIEANPYVNGRTLRFETDGSRVVMQGVVKSYFQKQMAQEAVRRVAGVEQVENCLEVTWV